MRRDSDLVSFDFAIFDLGIESDLVHLVFVHYKKMVAQAAIYRSGLDGLVINGSDLYLAAVD